MSRRIQIGIDRGSYVFDASAKTVTFSGFIPAIGLEQIDLIVNATRGEIIYSPMMDGRGGSIAGNILTLQFDTSSFDDADTLKVYVSERENQSVSVLSSETPLGVGGVFQSPWFFVLPWVEINVTANSNVPSASEGLVIEFSKNGINVDKSKKYSVEVPAGQTISLGVINSFCRITYTNGATLQTSFRLETIARRTRGKPSTHEAFETLSRHTDLEGVKAVMVAETLSGAFPNIRMTDELALLVSDVSRITPLSTVQVIRKAKGDVNSTAGVDDIFTIPNGDELNIQFMSGGAESSAAGSIVEMFEDPNGDLSVLNFIEDLHVNGGSRQTIVNEPFSGNGVRRIVLRRRRFDGGAKEMSARWQGFLR